ncbi:uncharacterized protein PAC_10407 [Phialocephala subalpina]|uniref:Uncharacterized protein n=1 Tax=Phialocephala subalpina TaxID=576137 RepID=A0A1L7X668_9HELO|nr:uncharacterized protein PAC_10407 [Phialocephala subalpina]
MAPPPATPSPHRFVIKKEAPARKSTLSSQQPQTQQTPRPSTQQFNTTPRFNISSAPHPTPSQSLPQAPPSASRFRAPAPKQQDAIDEDDDFPDEVHDSIETDEHGIDYDHEFSDDGDDYKIEERAPKRRRISTSPIQSQDEDRHLDLQRNQNEDEHQDPSSSLPILPSPPAKRPHTTVPKFLPTTPAPPSTPMPSTFGTGMTTFLKPPRFRPPDPAEQGQSQNDPLPEQFSPNRRGQKYVPGGLAAEVAGWLFNLESSVPTTKSRGDMKSEWLVRIVVDEVSGSSRTGFTMARGRQIHALDGDESGDGRVDAVEEVKVLLAGEGQMTGLQKGGKVEVGKRVGIKGQVWEVVIEGERWGVGVDWKVLT